MGDCIKFAVLYTQHLTKKRKTYIDGFVVVRGSTKEVVLTDEDGAVLCRSTSTAAAASLTDGATGIDVFDGYLVDVQEQVVDNPQQQAQAPPTAAVCQPKAHVSSQPSRAPLLVPRRRQFQPPARLNPLTIINAAPQLTHQPPSDDEIVQALFGNTKHMPSPRSKPNPPTTASTQQPPPPNPPRAPTTQAWNAPRIFPATTSTLVVDPTAAATPQPSGAVAFDAAGVSAKPQRTVVVPDRFVSVMHYVDVWTSAVHEELNLRLRDAARALEAAIHKCKAKPGGLNPAALQQALPGYATNIELQRCVFHNNQQSHYNSKRHNKRNKRSGDDDDADNDDDEHQDAPIQRWYMFIKSGLQKATFYHKGDLWVVSNNPYMQVKTQGDWVAIVRSQWHGPSRDQGKMEVAVMSTHTHLPRKATNIYALHAIQAATELAMLDTLAKLRTPDPFVLPTLHALLAKQRTKHAGEKGEAAEGKQRDGAVENAHVHTTPMPEAAAGAIAPFALNSSQQRVVRHAVLALARTPADPRQGPGMTTPAPVVIMHGPFGSGKSTVLVATIRALLACASPPPRVLIAAATNIAVDRVLLGLIDSGHEGLLRLGSLKRIDRRLLPYSLYCNEAKSAKAEAIQELKEMLQAATSMLEREQISTQLQAYKAGAEAQRRAQLKHIAVVGITCAGAAGAAGSALEGQRFDVVVLDECSQMIEPLALLPMVLGKPRLLIVAGDPQQLPPVVATPAHLTTTPPNTDTQHPAHHGIARPLFERLATTGQQVVLLDTQYRCHPTIAEIVNQCFYGGRLLHGCTAEQRPPLVEGLPPLLWLDVQGQEQGSGGVLGGGGGGGGNTSTTHTSAGGSLSNSQEAAVVGQLLRILVGVAGLDVGQCGVIACYKRQVACIEGYVGGGAQAGVQVATVDSFQGQEREVIILSTTATRPGSSAAFVSDAQRLNVALTRARRHLVVVGAAGVMQGAANAFAHILQHCRSTPGAYVPHTMLQRALEQLEQRASQHAQHAQRGATGDSSQDDTL